MSVKTCSHCKEAFGLDAFHRDKTAKDGHRTSCRACVLAKAAAKREAKKNAGEIDARKSKETPRTDRIRCYSAIWNELRSDTCESVIARVIADCSVLETEKEWIIRTVESATGMWSETLEKMWLEAGGR
jgi:hypothetical protein